MQMSSVWHWAAKQGADFENVFNANAPRTDWVNDVFRSLCNKRLVLEKYLMFFSTEIEASSVWYSTTRCSWTSVTEINKQQQNFIVGLRQINLIIKLSNESACQSVNVCNNNLICSVYEKITVKWKKNPIIKWLNLMFTMLMLSTCHSLQSVSTLSEST